MRSALSVGLLSALIALAQPASAEVRKVLRLQSTPPGAQVFVLRGSQRELIGVTPLQYEAEFHSEISILRFRFERIGYAGKTLEVPATHDEAIAALESAAVLADPGIHREAGLRQVQQRVNAALEGLIPDLLARWPDWQFEIQGVVRVRRIDERKVLLHLPVLVSASKENSGSDQLAQRLWEGPGKAITSAIVPRLKPLPEVSAILVDARVASVERRFAVGSALESRVEMVCVPGIQQVYDACATRVPEYTTECRGTSCITRQVGTKCVSGMKSVQVPCASRVPMTRTEVKINPQATTVAAAKRVYLFSLLNARDGKDAAALLHVDEAGKRVFERGVIPEPVLASLAAD